MMKKPMKMRMKMKKEEQEKSNVFYKFLGFGPSHLSLFLGKR